MKNIILSLVATTAISIATGAYAADESSNTQSNVEAKPNGGYSSTVKSDDTTSGGTAITSKTTADVDVDSNGKAEKTLKSDSVVDAKGLFNKKTHKGRLSYKDKDNGGYKKTVTVKDTDAAGANVYSKEKTDTDVDANGNVTSSVKTDKVIDPPGMMNKTETVTNTKTVNGVVTQESKETK